jgi:HEAT repeat protein
LLEEFEKATPISKPYILYLMAKTKHPHAGVLVSRYLKDDDSNLQHAAISGLAVLGETGEVETIRQIFRTTKDERIQQAAIETLSALAGAEGLEDYVWGLGQPDVKYQAATALRPYLVSHADRLREIADSLSDKDAAGRLKLMVVKAEAGTLDGQIDHSAEVRAAMVAAARRGLGSEEVETVVGAIIAVKQYELAELLPEVIDFLRSQDASVRRAATDTIVALGIPNLSLETAPILLGHSIQLDRHISAYCYAKYGRGALGLVKRAAFEWRDPSASGSGGIAEPAVGLIRVLLDEGVKGAERDVVRMIRGLPNPYRYVSLLSLLEDSASARYVGKLLSDEDAHTRWAAIRVARVRGLKQHADRLFAIATSERDESAWTKAQVDQRANRISNETFRRLQTAYSLHPHLVYSASLALMVMEDSRAWEAVSRVLDGDYLELRKKSLPDSRLVIDFGVGLAKLKGRHREALHGKLRAELEGEPRWEVLAVMVLGFSMDPEEADGEALRSVLSSPDADWQSKVLAVVGLSKLGDRSAVPAAQVLVREHLVWLNDNKEVPAFPWIKPEWSPGPFRWMTYRRERNRLLLSHVELERPGSALTHDHLSLGRALRRLGDRSMVDEISASLVNDGGLNSGAFRMLVALVGGEAIELLARHLEAHHPEMKGALSHLAMQMLDVGIEREEALALIAGEPAIGVGAILMILEFELDEAKERIIPLLETWQKNPDRDLFDDLVFYRALCRSGDERGLALAAEDPLSLLAMCDYLPDSRLVDLGERVFPYNRLADGLALQEWYGAHASELEWDAGSRVFRVGLSLD